MYQAMTVRTFQNRFLNDRVCRDYLFKKRWPKGFDCPRCGGSPAWKHGPRTLLQCKGCRLQVSLTSGTIFHKTRTSLRSWFWLIFLMSQNKHGLSMMDAQRLLGIGSYKTVWSMAHKIRTAMAQRDGRYKLAGIIELDDAIFGRKPKGHRGSRQGTPQKTVRVAVSTSHSGRPAFARMEVPDYAGCWHAETMAQNRFEPRQTIKTDGSKNFLGLAEKGFQHHSYPFLSPEQLDETLPWVHILISNAKRFLQGTHHQKAPKHLQRFLDEYCYRFNRRWRNLEGFDRLLTACLTTGSITFSELTE